MRLFPRLRHFLGRLLGLHSVRVVQGVKGGILVSQLKCSRCGWEGRVQRLIGKG